MRPAPRFKAISNPLAPSFKIESDDFLIGRSPKRCQFVLTGDNTVSRVHARLTFKDGRYVIKNLGQNRTLVNNRPIDEHALRDGDAVKMGQTVIQFQVGPEYNSLQDAQEKPDEAAQTVFMERPVESSEFGARLVLDDGTSPVQSLTLHKSETLIGRGPDADILLKDASVSRRHCMVILRDNESAVKNLSTTYPLLINGEKAEGNEKRLYSGDRIHAGSNVLTFISDRPQDAPAESKKEIFTRMSGAGWTVWTAATILLLLAAGFIVYSNFIVPWSENKSLEAIAVIAESGQHEKARDELISFLDRSFSPEVKKNAIELLTETTMKIAQRLEYQGALEKAQAFLRKHLRIYGSWKESEPLWAKLDSLYVNMGRLLESEKKFPEALKEYALIEEGSIYFEPAQKRIKAIWMESQKRRLEDKTLAELLERAEKSFLEKKYLTPVEENAYSAYRAVLEIDPKNQLAKQRIEQMKEFYRFHGEKHMKNGALSRALTYFERYDVIDPDNRDIEKKINSIRNTLKSVRGEKSQKASFEKDKRLKKLPGAGSENRDEVKKMLEESGRGNTWIMKYLFEDQEGEKDSENPW